MRLALLLLILLLAAPVAAEPDAKLLAELRQGGYVLFLRHASTDFSQDDSRMTRFEDCATVRLAFGKATAMNEVRGGPVEAARYGALKRLLSTPVPGGKNRVISSHGNPFAALAGPPYLAEGEVAVVRPEGGDSFSVIGRIRLTDW